MEPHSFEQVGSAHAYLDSISTFPDDDETFTSQFQNNFKPLKILGQGGFGCVFEAEKHVMGKLTLWKGAVKRIALQQGQDEVERALKEVEALLAFDHVGIIKFYDAWTEEPPEGWQDWADEKMLEQLGTKQTLGYNSNCAFLYIQMELCQSTLAEWLAQNKQRDLNTIKDWFVQIVSAVEYIHKMNYIHRDLKPSNILFASEDQVKVCDLGIVTDRAISNEDGGREVPAERTYAKGTRMYMAPEQMDWSDYSSKVDIFALGLIMAEMCVAMTTEEAGEIFDNYRSGTPNTILQHLPDAEEFVALLTNPVDTERPDCWTIGVHPFTYSERRSKEVKWYKEYRVKRAKNLVQRLTNARKVKQLEAKLATLTTGEPAS